MPSSDPVAVIPARLQSTRLPRKALALIGGRPMIQWVWERALLAECFTAVIVATDSDLIADAATAFGADVVRTPACGSGTERVAWVMSRRTEEWVVNIQADEPLIEPSALRLVAERLVGNDMASLMTPLRPHEVASPDVVKVKCRDGVAVDFLRQVNGPGWKRHIGVYGYRRDVLEALLQLPAVPRELAERLEQHRAMEAGFQIAMSQVPSAEIGVDTAADLERVRRRVAHA